MKPHPFDPGYTGLSTACNRLVVRDGAGDDCGLPRDHAVHVFPTPWEAVYETMKAGTWYAGTIRRMRDEVRRESKRCPHQHGRPDLALACARRMLEEVVTVPTVGDRVVYRPTSGDPERGVVTAIVNPTMVRVRYDGDETAKATYVRDLRVES